MSGGVVFGPEEAIAEPPEAGSLCYLVSDIR